MFLSLLSVMPKDKFVSRCICFICINLVLNLWFYFFCFLLYFCLCPTLILSITFQATCLHLVYISVYYPKWLRLCFGLSLLCLPSNLFLCLWPIFSFLHFRQKLSESSLRKMGNQRLEDIAYSQKDISPQKIMPILKNRNLWKMRESFYKWKSN